ncbi:MAG: Pycsar system effector family protein [Methanothrix sp.]
MTTTLEVMWRTYDTINDWIKFSDTKAGAISAANIAILAILFSKFIDFKDFIILHQGIAWLLAIGIVCGVLSIAFSIISLYPRINSSREISLIFFESIVINYSNYSQYKIAIGNNLRDDSDLMDQITEQIWINSKIAHDKYNKVRWSMFFFLIMLILIFITGITTIYFILC